MYVPLKCLSQLVAWLLSLQLRWFSGQSAVPATVQREPQYDDTF